MRNACFRAAHSRTQDRACYASRVRVPPWLTLGVAALVLFFGSYRIWLAIRKRDPEADLKRRSLLGGGFYTMNPRTHALVGVIYLMLGGALIATSLGWNPFGSSSPSEPPALAPHKSSAGSRP